MLLVNRGVVHQLFGRWFAAKDVVSPEKEAFSQASQPFPPWLAVEDLSFFRDTARFHINYRAC